MPVNYSIINGFKYLSGTTAQRPANPVAGSTYYNTTVGALQVYQNGAWYSLQSVVAPSIPTSVVATNVGTSRAYNNGSASVAFSPVTETGGAPASFTVTSSPGSFTATGASSPIVVTGLQSSTQYTYTVTATNSAGTSSASSASSAVTATTVPQAPTIGTATAGNAQASVTFTANATGGSAITSYTVTSSPGNFTATGGSSPLVVTGLTNGTSYTFTVTATNANGTSAASSASNSITPVSGPPVSGYKLWLDASDTSTITSSGGAVSQWTDKSANSYTFTQATSTNQPTTGTRTINSKNVIDFDGTNDKLISTATASTWNFLHNATNATVFVVLSLDVNQDQPIFTTSNDTTQVGIWFYTRSTPTDFTAAILNGTSNNFVTLEYGGSATYTANTPVVISTVWDADNSTTADRIKLYKNSGAETGTFGQSTVNYTTSNAASTMYIGAWPASNAFNGVLAEIIMYEGILSDANRNSVSDYLKTKWGVA